MRIRFDKIYGFVRVCAGVFRHLVLFGYRLFDKISYKIKYLISEKSGITDSVNHNFREIRIDSNNSLPIEKIFTFNDVIILIKSVVDKDKNYYYYDLVRIKINSYKDKFDTGYF